MRWQREGDANAGVRDLRFAWEARRKINRLHVEYSEREIRSGFEGIVERAKKLAIESALGRRGVVQEISGDRARVDFIVTVRHTGSTREFYGHNHDLEIEADTLVLYKANPDGSRVFIQNRDGVGFSASELLNWYFQKTQTKMEDYIPLEEAVRSLDEGRRTFQLSFPIDFTPNTFHMATVVGPVDLKRLELAIDITLAPKQQS